MNLYKISGLLEKKKISQYGCLVYGYFWMWEFCKIEWQRVILGKGKVVFVLKNRGLVWITLFLFKERKELIEGPNKPITVDRTLIEQH